MIETTIDQLEIGDIFNFNKVDNNLQFYKLKYSNPAIQYETNYLNIVAECINTNRGYYRAILNELLYPKELVYKYDIESPRFKLLYGKYFV